MIDLEKKRPHDGHRHVLKYLWQIIITKTIWAHRQKHWFNMREFPSDATGHDNFAAFFHFYVWLGLLWFCIGRWRAGNRSMHLSIKKILQNFRLIRTSSRRIDFFWRIFFLDVIFDSPRNSFFISPPTEIRTHACSYCISRVYLYLYALFLAPKFEIFLSLLCCYLDDLWFCCFFFHVGASVSSASIIRVVVDLSRNSSNGLSIHRSHSEIAGLQIEHSKIVGIYSFLWLTSS